MKKINNIENVLLDAIFNMRLYGSGFIEMHIENDEVVASNINPENVIIKIEGNCDE